MKKFLTIIAVALLFTSCTFAQNHEVLIGDVPELPGVKMYRMFNFDKGFEQHFHLNEDGTPKMSSIIVVHYIEYYKNANGVEVDLLKSNRKDKYYTIQNQEEVRDEQGNIVTPLATKANDWYYGTVPDGVPLGIYISGTIEYILSIIPMNAENGYVIK